ncbi:MAG: hypothetical protein AB2A00_37540 [Myxococcota bacterium]
MRTRIFVGAVVVGLTMASSSFVGAKPKAAAVKTKAAKCFELGRLLGSAYVSLDASTRARASVLEAYCRETKDATLGRVPTERDADVVATELANGQRARGDNPFVNTRPLDDQIRKGNDQEKQLLDSLLQQ